MELIMREAEQVGAAPETVNKWRRLLDHRKTVFEQTPTFDDQGKFTGWQQIN